jgi:hypothetical protein
MGAVMSYVCAGLETAPHDAKGKTNLRKAASIMQMTIHHLRDVEAPISDISLACDILAGDASYVDGDIIYKDEAA